MRTTLNEIARYTGFAKSTVSIAMRDDKRIPAKTRAIIQEAARKLGYKADESLSQMGLRRWRDIDALSTSPIACISDSQTLAPSILGDYLDAASVKAQSLGYSFLPVDIRSYASAASLCQYLLRSGVSGVMVPPVFHPEFLSEMDWSHFACVACGIAYWRPPFHVVHTDIFASVLLAVTQVVALGYRRIGAALFLHPESAEDDSRRIGAALFKAMELRESGVDISVLKSVPADRESFSIWIEKTRPEVVISMHSKALEWLTEDGFVVPDEVGYVLLNRVGDIQATCTDPRYSAIASTAVELLDLAIRLDELGEPEDPKTIMISPVWKAGKTLLAYSDMRVSNKDCMID